MSLSADLVTVVAGHGTARDAVPADAIDGVVPRAVVEPERPEALAEILAWCSTRALSVVIRGGGTKLGWGQPPGAIDAVLSTARLRRILAHEHGDLTATIEAGATLRDVNAHLASKRQWIAVESPFDEATIGGIIATNDAGPVRHRYGTPRDLLIGVRLATADGSLIKSGGNVVKNVAGYDLGRLMSGSFGTLGAIVAATFKLSPLPSASGTLVGVFSGAESLASAVAAVASSQLEPTSFDIRIAVTSGRPTAFELFLRFATTREAVAAQLRSAEALMAGADRVNVVADQAEIDLWSNLTRAPWAGQGAVMRVAWLRASLRHIGGLLDEVGRAGTEGIELVGRAMVGAGVVRVDGDAPTQIAAIERIRAATDLVGNLMVLRADQQVKRQVGVFGSPGDALALLRDIKRAFDPSGILNAGRGIV
jgi:glycolate oxidase FAD binding subunit